jgi:hypothetical protein
VNNKPDLDDFIESEGGTCPFCGEYTAGCTEVDGQSESWSCSSCNSKWFAWLSRTGICWKNTDGKWQSASVDDRGEKARAFIAKVARHLAAYSKDNSMVRVAIVRGDLKKLTEEAVNLAEES